MKNKASCFLKCLYDGVFSTINDDGIEHAGYMSFMILLCIFPFIIFFLALTSFIGASNLGVSFIDFLVDNLPTNTTYVIKNRMLELMSTPPPSLMTIAIIGSVWTASSFVEALRTILNRIYKIASPPAYIPRRLLSILQFFIIIALMFIAMINLVLFPIILDKLPQIKKVLKEYNPIWSYVRYAIVYFWLLFSVSWLYYMIPNVKIKFIEILPGAFVTVVLWSMLAQFLSRYITYYNQLSLIYGSLGSIILTLLFFYLINIIFIYGAEVNRLLSTKKSLKCLKFSA